MLWVAFTNVTQSADEPHGETVIRNSPVIVLHRLTNKDKIALRYCYSTTVT